MQSRTVLYLSYDGLTDPLGQSQILPYLCGLSSYYSISIISFEKTERLKEAGAEIINICHQNKISWVPLRYHKSPTVIATLFDIGILWFKARQLIRCHEVGIVHCRSYVTALVGLWLKKRHRVKFIFDMRGFWADERVEGGVWDLKNLLYRIIYTFFKRKEKEFLKQADHTIALTESAAHYLTHYQLASRITVIPCCVDVNLFNPVNQTLQNSTALRTELGLAPNDYVLGYVGSLGTWYLYSEMVTFFYRLKEKVPTARLVFLTPDQSKVQNHSDFVVRHVPRASMPAYISLFNASICFIKPTFSKMGSSATKIAEVLSMGVPVVVNTGWGDIGTLAENKSVGVFLENLDQEQLSSGVSALLALEVNPLAIRSFAVGYFSLEMGIHRYKNIYDHLIL
jgi:glycosyltransferase involved in cell wall biosynthesis